MPPSKLPVPLRNEEAGAKKGSIFGFIGALGILTLVAAGAGMLLAPRLLAPAAPPAVSTASAAAPAPPPSKYAANVDVKELPAIVTNLASPPDAFVRLQAAMVIDDKAAADSAAIGGEIAQDITAYLRTLSVPQLEGAAGLEYLREDLEERAAIRTNGRVHQLMIEALVVQ